MQTLINIIGKPRFNWIGLFTILAGCEALKIQSWIGFVVVIFVGGLIAAGFELMVKEES